MKKKGKAIAILVIFALILLFAKIVLAIKSTDVDGNDIVDTADLRQVLISWLGDSSYPEDINEDGIVNIIDSVYVKRDFNQTIETASYLKFEPGNYRFFKGCLDGGLYTDCAPDRIYTVRMDIEKTQDLNITYQGSSYQITSNPIRVVTSSNTPVSWIGGKQDFTFYVAKSYDNFAGENIKWALKSVFYTREPVPRSRKHTVVFIPNQVGEPPYFIAKEYQDISVDYQNNASFTALKIKPEYDVGGVDQVIDAGMIETIYPDVGWKVAFKMVNVDLPSYQGFALRIRFWEYDSGNGSLEDSTSINFDEWIFAKNIGLVAINNKIFRGVACNTDPDCLDQTDLMQTPTFSVALDKSSLTPPYCGFSTFDLYHDHSADLLVESVTKGAKYFNYDWRFDGQQSSWTTGDLASVSEYHDYPSAPCQGKSAGNCTFTTRQLYYSPQGDLNESITIGSTYHNRNITVDRTSWVSGDLATQTGGRYTTSPHAPCHGKSGYGQCQFTSRYLYVDSQTNDYVELITVDNNYYELRQGGWQVMASHDLTSSAHYNENQYAPCFNKAAGSCRFDSITRYFDRDDILVESVIIGDRYYNYNFDGSTGWWPVDINWLGAELHYYREANGPCGN